MVKDLIKFFTLWLIALLAMSCVGMLCFSELDDFVDLHSTMMLYLRCGLGDFTLIIYDKYGVGTAKYYFGMTYHTLVLLINLLIIVNVVIAVMADTYSFFTDLKLGLY